MDDIKTPNVNMQIKTADPFSLLTGSNFNEPELPAGVDITNPPEIEAQEEWPELAGITDLDELPDEPVDLSEANSEVSQSIVDQASTMPVYEVEPELEPVPPVPQPPVPPVEIIGLELTPSHSTTSDPVTTPADLTQSIASPAPVLHDERVNYADAKIEEIEVAKVSANPYQPRKIFDNDALKELAESIKEHGVIQPIVVTQTPSGYEIVVGERRFRASQLAGLTKVPAIVKQRMEDQTKLEVALIENIQRRELNPIEEAQAYDRLMKTFKLTQDQVAKKVGKSRPSVANTLRLLNLPVEIQRGVIEGKITEGHARAILGLPDSDKQMQMYRTIIENSLNVRQVELKVRELVKSKTMDGIAMDPKLMALETELRGKLGMPVKIQRLGRGGKVMIEFFSEEELNNLLGHFNEATDATPSLDQPQPGTYFTV